MPGKMVLAGGHCEIASATLSEPNSVLELLFDSSTQSCADGVRTSVISARQLLYRIGAVFVDLEVATQRDSRRASLVGQMLDSGNPGHPPAGVPVVLLDQRRRVASTSSNDYGEFQLEFAMKDNLKLRVAVNGGKPVHLPISPRFGKPSSVRAQTRSRSIDEFEHTGLMH